jgi:hypothetical protein
VFGGFFKEIRIEGVGQFRERGGYFVCVFFDLRRNLNFN